MRLLSTGVVTSPNYPKNYPDNLDRTETIEVENGKILSLEFTYFAVYACNTTTCPCDHVKITEGDGTTLMDKSCGYSTENPSSVVHFLPPIMTTKTNAVEIFFHTDGSSTTTGWTLNWRAVTPGLDQLLATSTHSCLFDPVILSSLTSSVTLP